LKRHQPSKLFHELHQAQQESRRRTYLEPSFHQDISVSLHPQHLATALGHLEVHRLYDTLFDREERQHQRAHRQ
jgi:hypothetical protein